MTDLEIFAAIWCGLIVLSLSVLRWLFVNAPFGFEDEQGFHLGEPEDK